MAPVGVNAPCRQLPAGSAPLAPSQRLCILFYGPKCLANILTRYMAVLRDSLAAWKQPQPAQRWRPLMGPVGCRRPGAPADLGRKQAQLVHSQTPRCTLTPNSIARSNIEKFGRETIKRVCAGVRRELFARVCARGSLKAALGLLGPPNLNLRETTSSVLGAVLHFVSTSCTFLPRTTPRSPPAAAHLRGN